MDDSPPVSDPRARNVTENLPNFDAHYGNDTSDENLGTIHCTSRKAQHVGEGRGWCYCHSRQCGACITKQCATCERMREDSIAASTNIGIHPGGDEVRAHRMNDSGLDVREGHVRRAISSWESLAHGDSALGRAHDDLPQVPLGRDLEGPEPIVTGYWLGRKTEICNGCHRDRLIDDGGWSTCECGRRRCESCSRFGCDCGRSRGQHCGDAQGPLTNAAFDSEATWDW